MASIEESKIKLPILKVDKRCELCGIIMKNGEPCMKDCQKRRNSLFISHTLRSPHRNSLLISEFIEQMKKNRTKDVYMEDPLVTPRRDSSVKTEFLLHKK
jgi:hypothetical protein